MADRKISDLTALTTPASGDYLPIVDISEAAAASKNKRITIEELFRGVPLGTAAAPSIAIEGNENTGVYSPGANQLAVATNGAGRLFVDASGNVGIGDSTPDSIFDIASDTPILTLEDTASYGSAGSQVIFRGPDSGGTARNMAIITGVGSGSNNGKLVFQTRNSGTVSDRVTITSAGLVGVGTASPDSLMHLESSSSFLSISNSTDTGEAGILFRRTDNNQNRGLVAYDYTADALKFRASNNGAGEDMRIDASGRLLVGTSSTVSIADRQGLLQVRSSGTQASISVARTDATGGGGGIQLAADYSLSSGTQLGTIKFAGNDGTDTNSLGASIDCYVDGTPGANDMPGRLTFSTTADGASSPTERLRINSVGQTMVNSAGTAAAPVISKVDDTNTGIFFPAADTIAFAEGGAEVARIDSSGRLLVGTSTARSNFLNLTFAPKQQLEGTNSVTSSASFTANFNGAGGEAYLILAKSRGSSVGSNTLVQSNDPLGTIAFNGADGTGFVNAAHIRAEVDGTPGVNNMPGRIVLSTTASGAATPTERMRIRNDGQVLIGGSSNTKSGKLEVTGRLAVLNGIETIQTGLATYTAATTATEVIEFDSSVGGFFGAELFVTLRDISSPAGTIVQKVYVAARGSGANVTAVSVSQSDILRQTGESGAFTGYLTWTAAVVSNRARLSVTATQTSGAATLTVHCNGSPFTFLI
jgi:hypothetical protein